jgi:2-polyprenyl-6-methoxyphenol hydroxylase-like FAD-dependent oxidoreductase
MRVGIVGAGIAGLAAAIALREKGVHSEVFEQAVEPRELGAGLHLWSNAVRALREIGLGEPVEREAVEIEWEYIHDGSGKRLVEWPVGDVSREAGAPSIALTRPALLQTLLDELGSDQLHLDRRLVGFTDDGSAVRLRFADDAEETFDLLVGADGLHSVVRKQLLGASDPRYTGYTSWRSLVPVQDDALKPTAVRQYWGSGARFVYFPVASDRLYIVCLANAPAGGRDEPGEARTRLLERFRVFAEPVPSLIASGDEDSFLRTDIVDRKPITTWGRGRVTLVGDAAHPMSPNTSQGAGMAIEDAAVLARLLAEPDSGADSLRRYERARANRANSQISIARFAGSLGRLKNPLACRVRNKVAIEFLFGGTAWRRQRQFIAAEF